MDKLEELELQATGSGHGHEERGSHRARRTRERPETPEN